MAERRAVGKKAQRGGATRSWINPPNDVEMEHFFKEERDVLSGARLRQALAETTDDGTVRICDGHKPTREVRLRIREDVFIEFRMMEVAYQRSGLPGSFISFLCRQFWAVWTPMLGKSDKWEAIYRRDRYRCACPICFRRDVTLHHLRYRSAGGGDEPDNLASICAFHHLEGEHGGRLKVRGPASRMTWQMGRRGREPAMVVVGRERVPEGSH